MDMRPMSTPCAPSSATQHETDPTAPPQCNTTAAACAARQPVAGLLLPTAPPANANPHTSTLQRLPAEIPPIQAVPSKTDVLRSSVLAHMQARAADASPAVMHAAAAVQQSLEQQCSSSCRQALVAHPMDPVGAAALAWPSAEGAAAVPGEVVAGAGTPAPVVTAKQRQRAAPAVIRTSRQIDSVRSEYLQALLATHPKAVTTAQLLAHAGPLASADIKERNSTVLYNMLKRTNWLTKSDDRPCRFGLTSDGVVEARSRCAAESSAASGIDSSSRQTAAMQASQASNARPDIIQQDAPMPDAPAAATAASPASSHHSPDDSTGSDAAAEGTAAPAARLPSMFLALPRAAQRSVRALLRMVGQQAEGLADAGFTAEEAQAIATANLTDDEAEAGPAGHASKRKRGVTADQQPGMVEPTTAPAGKRHVTDGPSSSKRRKPQRVQPSDDAAFEPYMPLQLVGMFGGDQAKQLEFVVKVLSECAAELQLAFNYEELVKHMLEGKYLTGFGETQGSKTLIIVAAALCGLVQRRPTLLMVCDVLKNAKDMASSKLQQYLHIVNDSATMRQHNLKMGAVYAGSRTSIKDAEQADPHIKQKITQGEIVAVINHSVANIRRAAMLMQEMWMPYPNLIMDEADKMWSTCPDEMEGTGDSTTEQRVIQRERALYRLLQKQEGARFGGIYSMLQVTATPPDVLAWHIAAGIPPRCISMDADRIREHGYIGPEWLHPPELDGSQVFLEDGDIKPGNDYGMFNDKVVSMYDQIELLRKEGKQGLLLIDISNPKVYTPGDNTEDRARHLSCKYNSWVFLVVRGRGVLQVTCSLGQQPVSKQVAWFTKRGAQTDDPEEDTEERLERLQDVLKSLDSSMERPVCVIGYNMIRRSLSVRSAARVPTHILCAPSKGISLADLVQMNGRAMGKNRDELVANGFKHVTVLAYADDFQALRLYSECMEWLFKQLGNGVVDMTSALETAPARFKDVLLSRRRQGQSRMRTKQILQSLVEFEDEEQDMPVQVAE